MRSFVLSQVSEMRLRSHVVRLTFLEHLKIPGHLPKPGHCTRLRRLGLAKALFFSVLERSAGTLRDIGPPWARDVFLERITNLSSNLVSATTTTENSCLNAGSQLLMHGICSHKTISLAKVYRSTYENNGDGNWTRSTFEVVKLWRTRWCSAKSLLG